MLRMLIKNKPFEFYTKELIKLICADRGRRGRASWAGSKQMTLYREMTQYVREYQGMRCERQAILAPFYSLAAIQEWTE